jgi:hypothetical protein
MSGYKSLKRSVQLTKAMTNNGKFSHRLNTDGTADSICHQCFVTVATERRETDLSNKEHLHSCNPALVEWYRRPALQLSFA